MPFLGTTEANCSPGYDLSEVPPLSSLSLSVKYVVLFYQHGQTKCSLLVQTQGTSLMNIITSSARGTNLLYRLQSRFRNFWKCWNSNIVWVHTTYRATHLVCGASRHSSTLRLWLRASSLVCATLSGLPLSMIAFLSNSIFFSTSKISCWTYSQSVTEQIKIWFVSISRAYIGNYNMLLHRELTELTCVIPILFIVITARVVIV